MNPLVSASRRCSPADLFRRLRLTRRSCLLAAPLVGLAALSGVVLWTREPAEPPPIRPLTELPQQPGWVTALVFNSNGSRLFSGVGPTPGGGGGAIYWDVDARRKVATFGEDGGAARGVALTTDGKTLAVGGTDGVVRFYDVAKGCLTGTLPRCPEYIRNLGFAPDGKTLVVEDATVRVYDVATGIQRTTVEGHGFIAFAPDGRSFATGGLDDRIHFWDTATGKKVRTFPRKLMNVNAAAFSADGSLLALGDFDGLLEIWDVAEGRCLKSVPAHDDPIAAVAFAPNGRTVATASNDRTVKLWDVATGTKKATLLGHTGAVYCVAFSPKDGGLLATGGYDRTVRLYDVSRP